MYVKNGFKMNTRLSVTAADLVLPPEDTPQQGGVEAFRWGETPLNLTHRHLVLRSGAEQGQAAGYGAEDLVHVHADAAN